MKDLVNLELSIITKFLEIQLRQNKYSGMEQGKFKDIYD